MAARSQRGAVPGKNNSGYGAERVSEEFYGDPDQMPDWAKPENDADAEQAVNMSPQELEIPSLEHKGTLAVEELTPAAKKQPSTVEELRASMQEILLSPPAQPAPAKKRSAKRQSKSARAAAEPEDLSDAQWREKARAILLRQLTASDKSAKQLKDKLLEKDCPEAIADEVIERFIEIDLVDDQKFAQAWVRARTRTRGLARGALKHELRSKGIDDEIAQVALEQVDDQDEEERARELVRVKLRPESMGVDRDKALRRLVGMLGRKGYNGSMAFRVAREEWDARFQG